MVLQSIKTTQNMNRFLEPFTGLSERREVHKRGGYYEET